MGLWLESVVFTCTLYPSPYPLCSCKCGAENKSQVEGDSDWGIFVVVVLNMACLGGKLTCVAFTLLVMLPYIF